MRTRSIQVVPPFLAGNEATTHMYRECQAFGQLDVETGGYLLRRIDAEHVTAVAVAGDAGIERGPLIFRVSGQANEAIQNWAFDNESLIVGQWHTHKHDAYMSMTDLKSGFNVPELTTVIIPEFGQPSPDPATWGWWVHRDGAWRDAAAAGPSDSSATRVVFDESGVIVHD